MIPPLSPLDLTGVSGTLRRWWQGVDAFLRGLGSAAQLPAETSLTSDSDQAVPTVKAVKAYADTLTGDLVAAHEAALDPHPQYMTATEVAAVTHDAPETAFTGYTPPSPSLIRSPNAVWAIHDFAGGAEERAKAVSAASWNEVFLDAFESGVTNFEIMDGLYPFRDVIGPNDHPTEIIRDGSYSVRAGSGAQLIIGAELAGQSGALLRFAGNTSPLSSDTVVNRLHWSGGLFRSELTSGSGFGLQFIDLSYFDYHIENCVFYGGLLTPDGSNPIGVGYVDTAVTDHQCSHATFNDNYYVGFYDTALYLNGPGVSSGPVLTKLGNLTIARDRFYRCNKAINTKRSHVGTLIDGIKTYECKYGVFSSAVTVKENKGYRFKVTNSTFKRTLGYCLYLAGESANIYGNEFEDWSHSPYDDSIQYPSAAEAPHAAVRLEGAPRWLVHHNHARMVDWAGTDWSSQTSRAPAFLTVRNQDNDDIADVASNYGRAHHNQVEDVHRVYHERSTGVTDYNIFENREMCTGETYTDVVVGANTEVITGTTFGRSLETLADADAALDAIGAAPKEPAVVAQATSATLAAADTGTIYTNAGATAQVVLTLPNAMAGRFFEFLVVDTDGIRVVAAGGDNILNGSGTTGGYIESATVGSYIRLAAVNTTSWYAMPSLGSWTLV